MTVSTDRAPRHARPSPSSSMERVRIASLVPVLGLVLALLSACDDGAATSARTITSTSTTSTADVPTPTPPPTTTSARPAAIELRLERHAVEDTEGFEDLVRDTLTDPRGWEQAGFEFRFSDAAPYRVLLAEPSVVDEVCLPYDTGGRFSCQIGPTVALNADRWREATDTWTGTLEEYRRMLVNHEVGHLLGRHHARPACDGSGPAAVMFQQSSGLEGCLPNPWPLPWEIACASRHDEPIAPGYEADARATCGPDDV
jgi:hypothetical protein